MSRLFNIQLFDGVVTGADPRYSLRAHEARLAAADRLVIQAVAVQATGTSPTLTVQLEHSADEVSWIAKNSQPEIDAIPLDPATTVVAVGFDDGWNPTLALARVRIVLAASAGSPGARLRLFACGRSL